MISSSHAPISTGQPDSAGATRSAGHASATRPANRPGCSLVWLRRDLRLHDHHALSRALEDSDRVQVVFVFDRDILDALPDKADRRVEFIWQSLREIDASLRALGSGLWVVHGKASDEIPALARHLRADAVFANEDYEPQAIARDKLVAGRLAAAGADLHLFKDQVIFAKSEVMTAGGTPFSVFTPYKNAWLKRLSPIAWREHEVAIAPASGSFPEVPALPELTSLGFQDGLLKGTPLQGGTSAGAALLDDFASRIGQYGQTRDFPAIKGPSYLSAHFRFGTISIRQAVRLALRTRDTQPAESAGASVWLGELIWRDFYFQILHHHPHVVQQAFKPAYDRITWYRDDGSAQLSRLNAFYTAQTGYPLVDAALRQLLTTGYMHNRLRMVVASFLSKDLGLDWRLGEAWFARHLIDFDLSANNGGWQWAASTGCDSQPWFRIFNPVTQSQKFDPQGKFIRRYVPQLANLSDKSIHSPWLAPPIELSGAGVRLGDNYPLPVVDHAQARLETLQRYQVVKEFAA